MGAITSANVATAIVKLVAADALPALMGNLVMGNLVNRDYEATLARAGDTVNVPIPPTLVANNISDGASVQLQNPAPGNAQIVLTNHVEASFQIPDVAKVLAVPDLLKLYMQPAVVALAERIESRPAVIVSAVQCEYGGGNGRDGADGSGGGFGGDGDVRGDGASERGEVPGGGFERVLGVCGRFLGSANSTRRVRRGCGRLSTARWER